MKKPEQIGEAMTRYPLIVGEDMHVKEAFEFMKKCKIRHLPVFRAADLVGIVSDRDLRQAVALSGKTDLAVRDVMTQNPYTVRAKTSLGEVAAVMAEKKIGCTIVVDDADFVIGLFTTTDGMKLLSKLLSKPEGEQMRLLPVEEFLQGPPILAAHG